MNKNENIHLLTEIWFPNTEKSENQYCYRKANGCHFTAIFKDGEMALIQWIQVWKEGKLIAEIKESVCNLIYQTN